MVNLYFDIVLRDSYSGIITDSKPSDVGSIPSSPTFAE